MLGSCSVFKWDLNTPPILLKQLKDWQDLLRRSRSSINYTTCARYAFRSPAGTMHRKSKMPQAETLLNTDLNRSQNNSFFSCAQTPPSPGSKPVSLSQQESKQQGCICPSSRPCQVPDPQPTTRFSSGLSGLLSWKYSTAFWILSMQFKYSSSLPVGLKIKPKIKSSPPRSKEGRYQESTRPSSG